MKEIIIKVTLLIGVSLFAAASVGAEAVKFRYVSSVYADEKGGVINEPDSVACGGGTVIVADARNSRLLRYTFQDDILKGGSEIKAPQLSYPIKVKISAKGDIFVLDGKQRRIIHLNPEGAFAGYVEPAGLPSPPQIVPKSFAVNETGSLYILDIFSGRVIIVDPDGKYVKQIEFPKDYGFFSDLAVNKRGDVLLLDSAKGMVFSASKDSNSFSPLTKSLKEYLNFPASIETDTKGNTYLVDRNGSGIVILGTDGAFKGRQLRLGWKKDEIYYPSDICVDGMGDVFVADRNNNRLQIYKIGE